MTLEQLKADYEKAAQAVLAASNKEKRQKDISSLARDAAKFERLCGKKETMAFAFDLIAMLADEIQGAAK